MKFPHPFLPPSPPPSSPPPPLPHSHAGSILSPGTVLLILGQNVSYVMTEHFGSSWTETIEWLLVLAAALYVGVSFQCQRKTQVNVAFVATTVFALLMMTVTVGVIKSMAVNKLANLQVALSRCPSVGPSVMSYLLTAMSAVFDGG